MAVPDGQVVDLWWADLRSADARLFPLLDDLEVERLERMDRAADRGRFVVGALLLRVAVAAATGVDPRSVTVERTCTDCGAAHGAPRVAGARVSVAHAGPLVLVGTADVAVGVDVESVDRGDDVARWVTREAVFKAGAEPQAPVTSLMVQPPLPRYLAALARAGPEQPVIVTHDVAESAAALEQLAAGRWP